MPPEHPPAYADVAAEALARQVKRLEDPKGRRARELEYELSIGLDILGALPVDQVDERAVEDMVDALIDQRLAIEAARERGRPLMEDYVDARTGRTHRRRGRGLSNSTIKGRTHRRRGAACRTRPSTSPSAPISGSCATPTASG